MTSSRVKMFALFQPLFNLPDSFERLPLAGPQGPLEPFQG